MSTECGMESKPFHPYWSTPSWSSELPFVPLSGTEVAGRVAQNPCVGCLQAIVPHFTMHAEF